MKLSATDSGFTVWLSSRDTYEWARNNWPASDLGGRRVRVDCDSNGLCDLAIDGGRGSQDCDGTELRAIVAAHVVGKVAPWNPGLRWL